jgi:mRNA-decapping enzyme subunit 2
MATTGHMAAEDIGDDQPEDAFDGGDENIFRDMTFDEVLEDLNTRFLVNLPKEEMSLVRVYWQAEQA